MNRSDKRFIVILIIVVILIYVPSLIKTLTQGNQGKWIVVYYKDQEVLRKSLDVDNTYQVEGSLGMVDIEVKDGKVRVEKENSPYHLCSLQGWQDSSNIPIVCLPNQIVVSIVSDEIEELDTVIQ